METVLISVLGVSPSVLTETVWALAQENPPLIPDRVIVLTTEAGKNALESAVFPQCGSKWKTLVEELQRLGLPVEGKLRFGLASDHVRLFPSSCGEHNLEDISTSEDNRVAADFIYRSLRAETANPDTCVLASIAGGRKTMSALLMSCMSLLGREQDRVLHVLVNSPYDSPLTPVFLFPQPGVSYQTRSGEIVVDPPVISLLDVPFVRMRGWYEAAFRNAPPSYERLVAGVQRQAPTALVRPKITMRWEHPLLFVEGGERIKLSAVETGTLWLLLKGEISHSSIAEKLIALKSARLPENAPVWLDDFRESMRFYDVKGKPLGLVEAMEALRRVLSDLRKKLRKSKNLAEFVEEIIPKRQAELTYPKSKIKFLGTDSFTDIRG